jgi:hypothetical protein
MPLEWISYPRATGILQEIENVVKHGGTGIYVLVGPPNNGKTAILDRLLRSYPLSVDRFADRTRIPVLGFEAPPRPALGRFLKSALAKTGALVFGGDRPMMMRYLATVLERVGTRILAIDDAQNLLAGPRWEQQEFYSALRELAERARISLLLIGTLELFELEPFVPTAHLLPLPAWPLDEDFREMAARVASRLYGEYFERGGDAAIWHRLTEGRLGELISLLTTLPNEAGAWDCRRREQWIPPAERFARLDDVL